MEHAQGLAEYMPHGMCLLWRPWLVTLWAGSDLLIFLSYTAIPLALLAVIRRRADVPHSGLVVLFASFILLCGLTHFLGVVTLWHPIYPFVGVVKLATGLVSLVTAIVLFRLIPDLVNLPSPSALADVNRQLRDEVAAHRETLASLENQVEARTADLQKANTLLAVQAREAVHRSGNLLAVVSSLANQTARGAERTEDFLDAFLARLSALAGATRSITEEGDQSSLDIDRLIAGRLAPLKEAYGERVAHEGPGFAVSPEAAQQISLALHELATNTQKYGLGADDAVRVTVSWRTEDGRFELVWRESGAAPAAPRETGPPEGFGVKLLTRVIPAILKGEAVRTHEKGELVYRLTAPVELVTPHEDGDASARIAARIIDDSFGLDGA